MGRSVKNRVEVVCDWRPPDPLKLRKIDRNYGYRWIRKNEVELRKQQGWEVVKSEEVGLEHDLRVSRGVTSDAECNELVLCKRSAQMGDAHRKYLDEKNKKIMSALGNQFHQEGQRTGFNTYGNIKIDKD